MFVASVTALPMDPWSMPWHIDPQKIGPEASELKLPEFDRARQNTLRRLYHRKRANLIEIMIEKHSLSMPTEEEYARTAETLQRYLAREENKARRKQAAQVDKIADGQETDESFKVRLKNRRKDLEAAKRLERWYRQRAEGWRAKAKQIEERPPGAMRKGLESARSSAEKFEEKAKQCKRQIEEISHQIDWVKEQLRQVEVRRRAKEGWPDGEGGVGEEDSTSTQHSVDDTENSKSQGSSQGGSLLSVAGNLGQQAGKFIGDQFRPWIKKTGDLILKQQTKGLGLPGHMGVPTAGGILAY
ncbi:MAG: hypothetical protein M1816_006084 [Peltula sp. TS41687]|nr:MAG: hypothetical protein M1816_006084 [Peltula sp. TS41687]